MSFLIYEECRASIYQELKRSTGVTLELEEVTAEQIPSTFKMTFKIQHNPSYSFRGGDLVELKCMPDFPGSLNFFALICPQHPDSGSTGQVSMTFQNSECSVSCEYKRFINTSHCFP
jgi:hypothetical protein